MKFNIEDVINFAQKNYVIKIRKNFLNKEYLISLFKSLDSLLEISSLADIKEELINYKEYILATLSATYNGNFLYTFYMLVCVLYLVSPLDVVTDYIPIIGFIDDIALLSIISKIVQDEINVFKVAQMTTNIEEFELNKDILTPIVNEKKYNLNDLKYDNKEVNLDLILDEELPQIKEQEEYDLIEVLKGNLNVYSLETTKYLAKIGQNNIKISEDILQQLINFDELYNFEDAKEFISNIETYLRELNLVINEVQSSSLIKKNHVLELSYDTDLLDEIYSQYFILKDSYISKDNHNNYISYYTEIDSILNFNYLYIKELLTLCFAQPDKVLTIFEFNLITPEGDIKLIINKDAERVSFDSTKEILVKYYQILNDLSITIETKLESSYE
ncbi:MAG: YkvA family protein [Mycoplasmatales bacterium]